MSDKECYICRDNTISDNLNCYTCDKNICISCCNNLDNKSYIYFDDRNEIFIKYKCPYCREYNNKNLNGYKLEINDVNLTNEDGSKDNDTNYPNSATVKKIIADNKIEAFPTIKMYKNKEVIDFDAKITFNNLEQMVDTILN